MKTHRIRIIVLAALLLPSLCTFAAEKTRVACIGDSITVGVGAKKRKRQAYPALLQTILGETYKVKNCGTSGIMMSGYLKTWEKKIKDFQPQIVTIKLGTNDTKGRKFDQDGNKEVFDKQYADAAIKLIVFLQGLESKPKIYLCLPVPVIKDKWGINQKSMAEDILPALKKLGKEKNLPIIDLYTPIIGKDEHFKDGVHPNEVVYAILAETIAKAITAK